MTNLRLFGQALCPECVPLKADTKRRAAMDQVIESAIAAIRNATEKYSSLDSYQRDLVAERLDDEAEPERRCLPCLPG
jgi:hypothetical protein